MSPRLLLLPALGLLASALPSYAGKGAALKPTLGTAGDVIAEDKFDASALDKSWAVAKGDWQIVDGAVVGKEKAADNHAGVMALNKPIHDTAVQFSLKLDGAKGCDISFNHPKGHLFRVVVTPAGVSIHKDGDKNDKSIKAAELGKVAAKFEPGQWTSFLIEVKGGKVAVQTDTGLKVEGSDPSLDVDKTGYRFVVRGESLAIDDFKAVALK